MIDLKNKLILTHQLLLTPQLKLNLKVLQLNTIELNEFILQEVQKNPFLEIEYKDQANILENNPPASEDIKLNEELNIEEFWEKSFYNPSLYSEPQEEVNWENILRAEESLLDYLSWQIRLKELTDLEREIAYYLIGNLDERGYLTIFPEEVAKKFKVSIEKVEKVRNIIKNLDPIGVACLDVKECLLTQLKFMNYSEDSLPYILIEKHLEELNQNVEHLSKKYGYSEEELKKALEVIRQLDPYPARNFFSEKYIYVEPDLIFYKKDGKWRVEITRDQIFSIKLNETYKKFLKDSKKFRLNKDTKKYLREKIRDAEMLLKALDSRYSSLYKVGKAILEHQIEFFEKGIKYLKPLTLKIISEDTGLHESTVSRIINRKYVQTPTGIYPLKFFFSTGYANEKGENISSKAVKDYIKEIIDNEDSKKPLSDSAIAKVLKEKYGIKIARRTVTKYREELGIPSIRERKNK